MSKNIKLDKLIVLIRHKNDENDEKLKKSWLIFDTKNDCVKYFNNNENIKNLGFVYDYQIFYGRLENKFAR